jgi:hypothetical protein
MEDIYKRLIMDILCTDQMIPPGAVIQASAGLKHFAEKKYIPPRQEP